MSKMADLTVDKLIENFPNSSFPKQEGKPTYEKIKTKHKLAAENVASIDTTRGGGNHLLLAIVINTHIHFMF